MKKRFAASLRESGSLSFIRVIGQTVLPVLPETGWPTEFVLWSNREADEPTPASARRNHRAQYRLQANQPLETQRHFPRVRAKLSKESETSPRRFPQHCLRPGDSRESKRCSCKIGSAHV